MFGGLTPPTSPPGEVTTSACPTYSTKVGLAFCQSRCTQPLTTAALMAGVGLRILTLHPTSDIEEHIRAAQRFDKVLHDAPLTELSYEFGVDQVRSGDARRSHRQPSGSALSDRYTCREGCRVDIRLLDGPPRRLIQEEFAKVDRPEAVTEEGKSSCRILS